MEHNIKLKVIGNKKEFPKSLREILKNSEKITCKNKKMQLNLALNYGFKDELINSVKKVIKKKNSIN